MYHWGKILGILFAIFSRSGFLGTALSFLFGYLVDEVLSVYLNKIELLNNENINNDIFIRTIFQVMGHISKSKGIVTNADIHNANTLMINMNLNDRLIAYSKQAFIEGKLKNFPLRYCLRKFYKKYHENYELIEKFLIIQIQTALLDNFLHDKEKKILNIISEELKIEKEEFSYIFRLIDNTYRNEKGYNYKYNQFHDNNNQNKLECACKVLGVKMSDDSKTIKRAYIKLMRKYHPDKLISKKVSKEIIEQAKNRTQDIQQSYNILKKKKILH